MIYGNIWSSMYHRVSQNTSKLSNFLAASDPGSIWCRDILRIFWRILDNVFSRGFCLENWPPAILRIFKTFFKCYYAVYQPQGFSVFLLHYHTKTLKLIEGTPQREPDAYRSHEMEGELMFPKWNCHGNVCLMNINMRLFMRMETWTKCDHEILSDIISALINYQHTFPQH